MSATPIDLPIQQASERIGLRAWVVLALLGMPLFHLLG